MGNKGMTLVEVIVGLLVFSIVSVIVMQVLVLSNRLMIEADAVGKDENDRIMSDFAVEMLLDNIEDLQLEGEISGVPAIAGDTVNRVIKYATTGSALTITVRRNREPGFQFEEDVNVRRIDVAVETIDQGSSNENTFERTLFLYEK